MRKNKVLKAITALAGVIFTLSVLSLDTPSWTPTIATVISGAWLVLFGLANGWLEVSANAVHK